MSILPDPTIRPLQPEDWAPVVALDEALTGKAKGGYWKHVLESYLRDEGCIGLAAATPDGLEGYVFGDLRTFEFGSERCGWVFALGVQPGMTRQGVASALLAELRRRFRALGVRRVRTMVQRTDVPLLSLFRSQSFVGGPFVQLELDLSEQLPVAALSDGPAPSASPDQEH